MRPPARTLNLEHTLGSHRGHARDLLCRRRADRLAVAAGADPDPRIVPFRGAYLRRKPAAQRLVRSLIYPVPDPSLPSWGFI